MLPRIFNVLPNTALKARSIQKGEVLFRQGDDSYAIFFLEKGCIQLVRHTENGEDIVIHRAIAGETFAEPSMFFEQYHCDAIALEDAELISIERDAILEAMGRGAAFAIALCARFASQVQTYRRRIEIQAIRAADERVFAAIADGMLGKEIKQFAAEIGLTHEATYRALAKLVKDGRIEKAGRGRYSMRQIGEK